MSTKTKSAAAPAPAADPEADAPDALVRAQDAIDLNDPHLSGQEAVDRNLKGED